MRDFKDESFINQYLSPKLIRDMKLFHIVDDDRQSDLKVNAIHDEAGYQGIRKALSNQYNLDYLEPDIQVYSVAVEGDRSMTLRYQQQNRRPLANNTADVLKYLHVLWQFPIIVQTIDERGLVVAEHRCPAPPNTN